MIYARVTSVVLVGVGLLGAVAFDSLNAVWGWINTGLAGGFVLPLFVRWYWERANGASYR